MWHSDLHANNIFVNPEKPTEIVAIIDWQSVHLSPFFLHARHPALIESNGQIPEGFGRVQLPENIADLSADQQNERRCSGPRSHSTNSTRSNCTNETRTSSARCNTARLWLAKLLLWLARFSCDGEPIVNGMLMASEKQWLDIVGPGPDSRPSVPCPLVFSAQEKTLQSEHEGQWVRGVELMEDVLDQVGAYRDWDDGSTTLATN